MDFLDKIFDEFNNNSISGLTDELKGLYIKYLCNKFKKNVIVVTNSLYQATNYYNLINNYFENSYFFPMDDFITTVLTTSSPDLMVKRLETLSLISKNNENIWTGYSKHNMLVNFEADNVQIGDLVQVKVTKAYSWHLFGEIVK